MSDHRLIQVLPSRLRPCCAAIVIAFPLWLTLHSMKPKYFLVILFLGAASLAISAKAIGVEPGAFAHSTQMIVVTTSGWDVVEGQLQSYERDNPPQVWRVVGKPISIVIG